MSTAKVAIEVAEQEFARMCAANRIDTDETELDKDELKEWRDMRDPIVRDICRGRLAIDTEGRPVYTTAQGKALTFRPATTATFIALQTYGKGKDVENLLAALGDLTGIGKGELSGEFARDFHAVSRIANLFLADR